MYTKNFDKKLDDRELLRVKLKSLMFEAGVIQHEQDRMVARAHKMRDRALQKQGYSMRLVHRNDKREGRRDFGVTVKYVKEGEPDIFAGPIVLNPYHDQMRQHRITVVRDEARCTHLAYGFIRGLTYEQMEQSCKRPPDWNKVRAMLKKYGPKGMVMPDCMREKAESDTTSELQAA